MLFPFALIPITSLLLPIVAASTQELDVRAPGDGNLYNGEIQYTGIECGDFSNTGSDSDKIWYIRQWLDVYRNKVPNLDDRVGLFFTGGSTAGDDFQAINNFNRLVLSGKGKLYYDVSDRDDFSKQGLDRSDPDRRANPLFWRTVYRSSKSLAAFSAGGTAYVYMKPNNCRTIFSDASQSPKDNDPDHGGQPTNGEVWYYSELPMLMRNTRINKIIAFYLKPGAKGIAADDFTQDTQWDADAPGAKPRTLLPDTEMDKSPATLPQAACRPPMKRNVPPPPGSNELPWGGMAPAQMKRAISGSLGPPGAGISISASGNSKSSTLGTGRPPPTTLLTSTTPDVPVSSSSTGPTGVTQSSTDTAPSNSSALNTSPSSTGPVSTGSGSTTPSSSGTGSASSSAGATIPTTPLSTESGSLTQPPSVTGSAGSSTGGIQTQPSSVVASITNGATATQASSTAVVLHSSVVVLAPSIQALIDNPTKDKGQEVLNKIKDTQSVEEDLAKKVGPPPSGQSKDCGKPKSIFDVFNAVSCVTQYLKKATDDIQKGIDDNFSKLDDIKDDLSNIQDIEPAIKYDPSDPDNNNSQDPSQSQTSNQPSHTSDQSSQTSSQSSSQSSSSSSSSSSSCTNIRTASACQAICQPVTNTAAPTSVTQSCSTTCSSTFSGCSATGTISTITSSASASACPISLGGGTSIPASSDPAGPYTTAWWDYGISCAGSACSILAFPSATGTDTIPSETASSTASSSGMIASGSSTAGPPSSTPPSSSRPPPSSTPGSSTPPPPSSTPPSSTAPPPSSTPPPPSSTPPPPSSTRPPPPTRTTCIDGGTYESYDECSNYCNTGFCQENAGQPKITCSCN